MPTNIVFNNNLSSNSINKDDINAHNIKWLRPKIDYKVRTLLSSEVEQLKQQGNTAENWNLIQVGEKFDITKIWNSHFYGLVRIEAIEDAFLEHHNLRLPVGIYDSLIIESDIGSNCVIRNVRYLSHFVISKECILFNICEMQTSIKAKFGIGIIKESEENDNRIFIELCNENGGRKVAPFNGMLTSDAFLWSKFRDDKILMQKFLSFTDKTSSPYLGYYGQVGERSTIKNCKILKDVLIGPNVYIKGSNKLKNLSINSSIKNPTQIGEGCELVNGIIGYGCKIFYGVKAVRFVIGDNSSLKYGARLINSIMGENSTISCCEVLNSLIYPFHEQHHNNSFLVSALLMGQSNIAAGATIGSNHNSRSADGELIASRGFWPGLSVSLKYNSKFASFTIISKALYNFELDIPLPFSLVSSIDNELCIMPAYWWMYNAYALKRNEYKYLERDKRIHKKHNIEHKFLAPDTVSEIVNGLKIMEQIVDSIKDKDIDKVRADNVFSFENSKRPVFILKPYKAIKAYKEMLLMFIFDAICCYISDAKIGLQELIDKPNTLTINTKWYNLGGQLLLSSEVDNLKNSIYKQRINCWDDVHNYYVKMSRDYLYNKAQYALSVLDTFFNVEDNLYLSLISLKGDVLNVIDGFYDNIILSRQKDYESKFRQMTYDNVNEMQIVLNKHKSEDFICSAKDDVTHLKHLISVFVT
ncbi:MAG: DUF4954 family protein [Solitalea-like symbiont of Tyrophagus putrescentiae]